MTKSFFPSKRTITLIVTVALVTVTTLWLSVYGIFRYQWYRDEQWKEFREGHQILVNQLAIGLALPLWNFDHDEILGITESVMDDQDISGVVVKEFGTTNAVVIAFARDANWQVVRVNQDFNAGKCMMTEGKITLTNETIGTVKVFFTPRFIDGRVHRTLLEIVANIVALDLLLLLSSLLLLQRILLRPLKSIERYAASVSTTGEPAAEARAVRFRGELESVRLSIVEMVRQLKLRYEELQVEMVHRRESEERFRTIFNSVNDAIFIHEIPSGVILDVNSKMCEMYGYGKEDALRLNVEQLSSGISPHSQKEALEWIRKATQEGPQLFEWIAKGRAGNEFYVEVNMRTAILGGKARMIVVVRDISDRKLIETQLRESEEYFRTLANAAFEGIAIVYNGLVVEANDQLLMMFGYEKDEMTGRAITEFVAPESRAMVLTAIESGNQEPYEHLAIRKDGSAFPVEIHGRSIHYHGREARMTAILDITGRKEAQIALRESEERFRMLFTTANDAILIMKDDVFIDCNSRAVEMFGCARKEDLVNHTPVEFSPAIQPDGSDSPTKASELISAALQGKPQNFYWKHRLPNGTLFDAEVSLNSLSLDHKMFLQAIVRDVSDRKKVEMALHRSEEQLRIALAAANESNARLKELDQLKSEFVSLASHELRTPLTSIIGFAQTLMSEDIGMAPAERSRYFRIIIDEGFRLVRLISELLDLSKIEQGAAELDFKEVDLEQLIRESIRVATIPDKVGVAIVSQEDVPKAIADPSKIEQVLLNLFDNAVRHMGQGGEITVRIDTWQGKVRVAVQDTGTGIPENELTKIFDRFYRVKSDRAPKGQGCGLGLSVAREIIITHKGEIWAESHPDQGATFFFTLPFSGDQHAKNALRR